jgi:dipeptidyl aminopeptidase/acylaminoacyl peptidase
MPTTFRHSTFVVSLLALLAASVALSAEPVSTKPLIVDDLYRFDAPRDAALSPDGKSLVYARQWIDSTKSDRSSLWLVEGDRTKARPVEKGEPDARTPVFSPDGKWIAFLSTRSQPDGRKRTPQVPPQSDPATDVWLLSAAGGEAIPLALAEPGKPYGRVFNDGFYGRLAFSPDGTKLAFIADDGESPRGAVERINNVTVVRGDQGEGYTGWDTAQLWVAHLDPKPGKFAASRIERLTDNDVWYGDPNWHPDGKTIVVHANRTADRESVRYSINKNFDLWSIDTATRRIKQLTTGPGPEVSPRFSPNGNRLACLSVPRKGSHRDAFNLAVIDLDGDAPRFRVIIDHHSVDPGAAPVPAFPLPAECWEGNERLLINFESRVTSMTRRVDAGTGPLDDLNLAADPKSPAARIALRSRLTPPGNAFLKERVLGTQKVITWKSDDFTIDGILTLPPEEVAKPPYRLLVYPHGGPHSRSTLGFDFTVQLFAAHGYAVLQPNFRGSSGYGQKFIDADRGDFGGGDMRDILAGVDKLIADGVADKDRLFVYGTSYGGFMTTWLVGQTDRFRAAVAQNAVTDLNMMWGLSDLQSWTEWEFGGKPWEVPDLMRKHSPISYVARVKTPTLVLHSRDDRRVPMPMGLAYYRSLKSHGVPTGLVIYPDEGHGIRQPRHREDVLRRTLAWFAEHDKK